MNPRRFGKRDANEKPLVKFASDLGAFWLQSGPFDGWLWWRGRWLLVEVKNPDCEGHKDEYTPDQIRKSAASCGVCGARKRMSVATSARR